MREVRELVREELRGSRTPQGEPPRMQGVLKLLIEERFNALDSAIDGQEKDAMLLAERWRPCLRRAEQDLRTLLHSIARVDRQVRC